MEGDWRDCEGGLAGLSDWAKEMMVSPLIQKMKANLETLRQEELDRYQKKATPAVREGWPSDIFCQTVSRASSKRDSRR